MLDDRPPRKIRVLPIIRSVRTRWRMRMAFRGLAIVLGAGFLAFLLSAYGLEAARFSPGSVTALRIAAWSVVVLLSLYFLVRPLMRRISDEQVALYLEEHEPSLEAALLGALEVERGTGAGEAAPSPALLERMVERAVDKARAVDYGRRIDRRALYQSSGALLIVFLGVLLFGLFGPRGLRYGVTALALPTTEAAEVSPYTISVSPGDVTVARGSDQLITAELRGFDSDDVSLFSTADEGEAPRRISMLPSESGGFELLLLNLVGDTWYFVEANGVRSASYTIEVADLPYVEEMTHRYVFPAYTGLDPREVEGGGHIAVLEGTRVEMVVRPTLETPGGRILVDDSTSVELTTLPSGALSGEIQVRTDGVYRIDLARGDGQLVEASPEYTIDVLSDMDPAVVISDPGRDAQASAIEEIFIEAQADDDYGIGSMALVYSVNGQAEDTVALFRGGSPPLQEVTAGHTLFLEELELEVGDVISYYAVARDNRTGTGVEALSDIYFINVRPFRRDFRQADQQQQTGGQPPAGGGGGAGMEENGSLSELQREVVAATFNLVRDRDVYSPEELSENTVSVALAQGRVRDEVASLLVQMNTRGVAQSDPHFQEIAELLPVAVQDMESAESLLREGRTREALPPEQRALRVLQKAEETYERVVQQQQQGGGGGGGGGGASADELADLFELELDKLQNQYETVQRGERQQADAQVDELLEKLKELARRQQQEMERQRRRAEAQQGGAGGAAGESQRELADEAEETARQLEELSRRTGDQELAETARRLQEAAETMRRSASRSGRNDGLAEATSALDDLEEAQRRLARNRDNRMQEGIQDALDRVDRLAEAQERVREDIEELPSDPEGRREGIQSIHQQKDEMVQETRALERDLFRMQQGARMESREASEELEDAVAAIRDRKMEAKIAVSKGIVERQDRESALEVEDQISSDIEALRDEVEAALQAYADEMPDPGMEEALEEARELARGAESLGRRLQSRGQGRESDQANQPSGAEETGEAGEAGEAGAEGQAQGDEGRAGQEGAREGQQAQAGEGRTDQEGREGQRGQQAGQGGERTGQEPGQGGGLQGDSARTDEATRAGQASLFGGATRGNPEPFTEEEIRQFTREFAQRLAQAQELREALGREGVEIPELEEAVEAMEALRDARVYEDLPQIDLLQEQLLENLKRVEFILRRDVEGESEGRAALTGTDDVPAGFREMVEEYFRNLARNRGGSGGG